MEVRGGGGVGWVVLAYDPRILEMEAGRLILEVALSCEVSLNYTGACGSEKTVRQGGHGTIVFALPFPSGKEYHS